MDKLELVIREKQAELRGLQAELDGALTGPESPDYETAWRIQPLIYGLEAELDRMENMRSVRPVERDFQHYLSRLLTDDTLSSIELWTHIHDHWNDVTVRVLEIRKAKTGHRITCILRLEEPTQNHLHGDYTSAQLQHIGWKSRPRGKTFYHKSRLQNPDAFDRFCQLISVTLLEAVSSLWGSGQQYYRFR